MSGANVRLFDLSAELAVPVSVLASRAWELGIVTDGPDTVLSPEMAEALRATLATAPPGACAESGTDGRARPSPRAGKSIRVYELAAEVGITPAVLVDFARSIGVTAEGHLARLGGEPLARLREELAVRPPDAFVEERLGRNLKKRRKLRPHRRKGRTGGIDAVDTT